MKLLVIGAGYVGMTLLSLLRSYPHEVWITTTKQERFEELRQFGKGVHVLEPQNASAFSELVAECDAMIIMVAPCSNHSYQETYLETAQKIASLLKNRARPVHVIYTGSTSVCSGSNEEWIFEDTPLNPDHINGKILLETEQTLLNSNADTCILRLGGIYGPERELKQRAQRMSGKKFESAGSEYTNHIHLDDVVGGIIFCLENRLKGIFHLVNDDHPARKEIYDALCFEQKIPPPIWNNGSLDALGDDLNRKNGYKVSNTKIKETGFRFKHPHLDVHLQGDE